MVVWQSQEEALDTDLPGYLAEPDGPPARDLPRLRDVWAVAHKLAVELASPPSADRDSTTRPTISARSPDQEAASHLSGTSIVAAVFFRLEKLPGAQVGAMLEEWWETRSSTGLIAVGRRLTLARPEGDAGIGWTMNGQLRHHLHWVPVVVELWPVHDQWTMMSMRPQVRIVVSLRYFRTGHATLDRLTRELDQTSAGSGRGGRQGPSA